ncbi:MAG: hypothetical protein HY922_13275 [Elusimicrobia bacterium]|nr:hypothetical protein [Elusimicrobiota bacterium]
MNPLGKLLFHVERLDSAVDRNRIFFGSIIDHVRRFRRLLLELPEGLTQGELVLLSREVDGFFNKWRPPRVSSSAVFIPPGEIADLDWTVREISALVEEIGRMPEGGFRRLMRASKSQDVKKGVKAVRRVTAALEKSKCRIGFQVGNGEN